jgi:hypothetical protein
VESGCEASASEGSPALGGLNPRTTLVRGSDSEKLGKRDGIAR